MGLKKSGYAICARRSRVLKRNNIYFFSMGSFAQAVLIKLSENKSKKKVGGPFKSDKKIIMSGKSKEMEY